MNLIKALFLDFDGVLNHRKWIADVNAKCDEENLPIHELIKNQFRELDAVCVARINKIVEATGAKIVVSSTWRLGRTVKQLQELLDKNGFIGEVIDTTPHLVIPGVASVRRGPEIQAWFDEAKKEGLWEIESFVIIDDESEMEPFLDKLVKTSFEAGILDEHVELAIKMLEE